MFTVDLELLLGGVLFGFGLCLSLHTSGRMTLDYLQHCVDRTHWRKSMPRMQRKQHAGGGITRGIRDLHENS